MLCLLLDYFRYRSRRGPYSNSEKSIIPDLFEGNIPDEVISLLKPGDLIWLASMDSIRAWLIMYYCQIPISHVCTYLGARKVSHATVNAGVITEDVDELFDRDSRFLPAKVLIGDNSKRRKIQILAGLVEGLPYSYKRILLSWLYIVTGRNWRTFRWKFYGDFLAVYAAATWILPVALKLYPLSLAVIHLAVILTCALAWNMRLVPFGHRGLSLNLFFEALHERRMLPLVNRFGTYRPEDVVAAFRERE